MASLKSLGEEERDPVCIGVDVGKVNDPTAIAVAEVSQKPTGRFYTGNMTRNPIQAMETQYTLRHIERLPLGTSYPDVANYICDLLGSEHFKRRHVRALVDVTGVGRGVYDIVERETRTRQFPALGVTLQPISFVHGEKYNQRAGTLGKAYLVSRLQALLQCGQIHAPDTAEVRAMQEELRVYEIKIDQDGKDTYGAFKVGSHDDLATALALAVLEDPFSGGVSYIKSIWQ